jgi:hypothetical protein
MKVIENLANDAIKMVHTFYNKDENKMKIDTFAGSLMDVFIEKLKPYFFLITGLLVVMIIMSCIQFYYYIKVYLKQYDMTYRLTAVNEIL